MGLMIICLTGLLRVCNKIMNIKNKTECVAYNKYSVNIRCYLVYNSNVLYHQNSPFSFFLHGLYFLLTTELSPIFSFIIVKYRECKYMRLLGETWQSFHIYSVFKCKSNLGISH